MIFKKLIQKFDISHMPIEEKLKIAKKIVAKFNFEICEQLSEEELKISIQAILLIIFVSHGIPPTVALFLSKIIAEVTFKKIMEAEDLFDYLKANLCPNDTKYKTFPSNELRFDTFSVN